MISRWAVNQWTATIGILGMNWLWAKNLALHKSINQTKWLECCLTEVYFDGVGESHGRQDAVAGLDTPQTAAHQQQQLNICYQQKKYRQKIKNY